MAITINSKVLLDAAELIRKKGWVVGSFRNRRGHCLIGALVQCVRPTPLHESTLSGFSDDNVDVDAALDGLARAAGFNSYRQAHHWNDAVASSADEVIRRLEAMAQEEEVINGIHIT